MYKAIAEIKETFEKADLKFSVEQMNDKWAIRLNMEGDASKYQFLFIKTDDDGNDVAVRVFNVLQVPQKKRKYMIRAIHDLSDSAHYVKWTLDDDDTLTAGYDFLSSFSPIGPGACEVLMGMVKEMDIFYPVLASVAGQ